MIHRRSFRAISGHTALETAIFLPLFMLFLFAATDAGMDYVERSGVTNKLRASLQSETLKTKTAALLTVDNSLSLVVNPDAPTVLNDLASEIFSSLLDEVHGQSRSDALSLTLSLVLAEIDPMTGVLLSYSVPESVTVPVGVHNPALPQFNPNFHYVTREQFLDERLGVTSGATPSPFATSIGASYGASPTAGNYFPVTAVLYAEVDALTRGVNPEFVRQVLGNYYALENQQLAMVRTQIR